MVKQIKTQAELENAFATAAGKAVLVDFFATWCGPCMKIAPAIEQLSHKYPNVVVLKVDVDDSEEIAVKYDISAMPTFILFKGGEKVDTIVGADSAKIEQLMSSHN